MLINTYNPPYRLEVQALMIFVFVLILLFSGVGSVQAQLAADVPPEFADTYLTTVNATTALAFTPDGRLLIASQYGALRIYQNGTLLSTPALNLSSLLCDNSERGLLG